MHNIDFQRYTVYIGNFGSGKTEIALNTVFGEAARGRETVLVDMDIINPYFKSSSKGKILREQGIRVIQPRFANTMVDVPVLPGEIFSPFDSPPDIAVFDVGGDPAGAAALGQLKERFLAHSGEAEFLFVINGARPMQESVRSVVSLMREIEKSGSFHVTGIVNNTNLATETDMKVILQGERLAEQVCKETGIPPRFIAIREDIAHQYEGDWPVLPIHIYMRPEWLDSTF